MEHLSVASIIERVERGVKFLDDFHEGTSWVMNLDLNDLDLASPDHCVLGQIFPSYDKGVATSMNHLGIPVKSTFPEEVAESRRGLEFARTHGFEADAGPVSTQILGDEGLHISLADVEYDLLTSIWRNVLLGRLDRMVMERRGQIKEEFSTFEEQFHALQRDEAITSYRSRQREVRELLKV